MRFRDGVRLAFSVGKELLNNRQEERQRQEADVRAWEERIAREHEASLQLYRAERQKTLEAEQPQIDALSQFAGRLILITNPQGRLGGRTEPAVKLRQIFSETITQLFVPGSAVGVSTHASPKRMEDNVQRSLNQVVDTLRMPFARRGIGMYRHLREGQPAGTYVAEDSDFQASLAEAVQGTAAMNSVESSNPGGHLAVVSALGVHNVGLDYDEAKWGRAYVLESVDENHQFSWRKVFDTVAVHSQLWSAHQE